MRLVIKLLVLLLIIFLAGSLAGYVLVVNKPESSDAILVLGGDHNDYRFHQGLQLLQQGRGRLLLLDANSDEFEYGRTSSDQEQDFAQRSAGPLAAQVIVCPIEGDSTVGEVDFVERCLRDRNVRSVLLVTSAFHTRRSLSIFRARLPQYHWSVSAVADTTRFSQKWWQRREWAKTTVLEWTKLLWWQIVDRWRH